MTDNELKEIKARCLEEMRVAMPKYAERLEMIDHRVLRYATDVVREDVDIHNLDEILCLRKFLRLMDTYEFDYDYVHQVIYDAEGEWAGNQHIEGGLKIDGIYGYGHYRQTAMQIYCYAWIYGFRTLKDTTSPIGSRAMLESEHEGANGTIWDKRRLVTQFVLMWPRKVAKTFTGAFVQFEGLMRGERDYEGYIAANSADQSAILFKMVQEFVHQMKGWERYFKITNSPQDRAIAWKRHTGKTAFVKALTAGGKKKDGLKACCCSADEFGASQRISGKIADMEGLVNVIEGSMGPRREPLTVHTSTAGLGVETPYELMINQMHDSLLDEMQTPLDGHPHRMADDWMGGIILRPDAWEREDEQLLRTERVIRKVNPNLGVTIQPDFYMKEWAAADKEGDGKRKEVITKLYNIFSSDRAVDWITADEIRPLQVDMRIEDCKASEGWVVLTGMDYTNIGDDLQASTYLAIRAKKDGGREFFADMDAWISEETVQKSPLSALLRQWADEGWLHIVPGSVLSPEMPVNRIVELRNEHGVNMMGFGYDPFKAKEPITLIKNWVLGFGVRPQDIANYVMPVSQTFGSMSPLIDEVTYSIKCEHPLIRFSQNPLWPWEFSNCQLIESSDGMENKKIIKTKKDYKIDNCQGLCNAYYVYDQLSTKVIR